MPSTAQLRKTLRPHGIVAAPCRNCCLFSMCGGIQPESGLFQCFDLCHCRKGKCDTNTCDPVCLLKPDFSERVWEIRGLCFDNLAPIAQQPLELPQYVPVIQHGYRRSQPLNWPVVAIETYELFRLRDGRYRAVAEDPEQIRKAFCLAPNVSILLLGTADDPALEEYWAYRQIDHAPRQIAKLGVLAAIGPNFSHFLDVPRTDNLFNRKRQLICVEELHQAGISPIPHLSATAPGDWRFWRQYLVKNATIGTVAIEFQTGNRNRTEGRKVIERLERIQRQIGRPLHFVMVGGGQFIEYAAARFERVTLIDSQPFMNTMKRYAFGETVARRAWQESYSLERQPLDDLLVHNIQEYCSWAESAVRTVHLQHNWPRPR